MGVSRVLGVLTTAATLLVAPALSPARAATPPAAASNALSGEVIQVSAGSLFSLALLGDGTVWAWGNNYRGQLGDGTTIDRHTPVQVVGLDDVVSISAGYSHSLARKADGTV